MQHTQQAVLGSLTFMVVFLHWLTKLAKVAAGKTFTDEQREWLGYIAEHLVESLTLSEEDFDLIPVFTQVGGVGKARRVFRTELKPLIDQINMQVAATA